MSHEKNDIDFENGLMTMSDYEEKPFEHFFYVYTNTENGFALLLYAIKVYGTAYYYPDGKVHLYSLGSSSYIYVDDVQVFLSTPIIKNRDGSLSDGTVCFSVYSSTYDGSGVYLAWVILRKNSTTPEFSLTRP